MDKYKQFISNITINRGRFAVPDGEYKERHHIVPKCMGGSDDEENLVDLLLREHIIAHKLLADIYPSCGDVQYAFWMMCNCREYDDVVKPAEYEAARKSFSKNHPMKRPEVVAKIKGEKNPMKRPEVAAKHKGENNPMKRPEVVAKQSKPVEAIDSETGRVVHHFKSIRGAGRAGFDPSHVCDCCNGKRKTHKGFIWRYVEEVSESDGDN